MSGRSRSGRLPAALQVPDWLAGLHSRVGPAAVLGAAAGVVAAGLAVGVAAQRAAVRAGDDLVPPVPQGSPGAPPVEQGSPGAPPVEQGVPSYARDSPEPGPAAAPGSATAAGDAEPLGTLRGAPTTVTTDDGVRLHVETDAAPDAPAGDPTVVFVHGFGLNIDIWHFQRAQMRGRHRLVLLDQRGHGRSGMPPPGTSTIDRLGRDLGEVLDAVVPDGPVVVVGHSMGGMATLALASQRPELFGTRIVGVALVCSSAGDAPLVLGRPIAAFGPLDTLATAAIALSRGATKASHVVTNSALQLAGQAPALTARARSAISSLEAAVTRRMSFARPVPDEVARFSGDVIASTPVAVIAGFYLSFFEFDLYDTVGVLRRVQTLVLSGDSDRITPPWHGAQIAARLPDARVVELSSAGHMAFLEAADEVTDLLEDLVVRAAEAAA